VFKRKVWNVAGLSRDKVASHAEFTGKLGLKYHLSADLETDLMQSLGFRGEKKMYGKVTQGAISSTFVVSASGKVQEG